jgi:hypothetical protein
MKKIFGYLIEYISWVDKRILSLAILFVASVIFINYYWRLNDQVENFSAIKEFASWYLIFFLTFTFGYALPSFFITFNPFKSKIFLILLFIAPAIFAWKMAANIHFHFSGDLHLNAYWNAITYWPLKLAVVSFLIFVVWILFDKQEHFYAQKIKGINFKPYLLMLLVMLPLIAVASTQPDFLAMYPKMKSVEFLSGENGNGFYKLLYELSYGSDFIGIELFFRGFLILAFIKYAGKHAILPMAMFYCTIHFGKPLAECISSFFGGIILGVVTYHTRTIWGGLIVHLGIAWLMELGGYLGNLYK